MGQQTITGAFRTDTAGKALVDGPPAVAGYTTGATIVDIVNVNVPLGESWQIVSWTIAFTGALFNGASGLWAKFGRVIGGLIYPGASQTLFPAGVPYVQPAQALPQNLATLALLWDGSTDPPFPALATNQPQAFVVGSLQLPVPVSLKSSETVGIGMWLTPSLIPSGGLPLIELLAAQYTIVFDDGGASIQGWTG